MVSVGEGLFYLMHEIAGARTVEMVFHGSGSSMLAFDRWYAEPLFPRDSVRDLGCPDSGVVVAVCQD